MKSLLGVSSLLVFMVAACGGERAESSRPAAASPQASPQEVSLEERHDAPPPAPIAAPAPAPAPAMKSHAAESCGELAMTRVGLIEEGRGDKHPEVLGVDALLAQCEDKAPSADACRRVKSELTESTATGYGPNHPHVRSLRAKEALCPK